MATIENRLAIPISVNRLLPDREEYIPPLAPSTPAIGAKERNTESRIFPTFVLGAVCSVHKNSDSSGIIMGMNQADRYPRANIGNHGRNPLYIVIQNLIPTPSNWSVNRVSSNTFGVRLDDFQLQRPIPVIKTLNRIPIMSASKEKFGNSPKSTPNMPNPPRKTITNFHQVQSLLVVASLFNIVFLQFYTLETYMYYPPKEPPKIPLIVSAASDNELLTEALTSSTLFLTLSAALFIVFFMSITDPFILLL